MLAVIVYYFTDIGRFGANYIKVFEVRPVLSVTKM